MTIEVPSVLIRHDRGVVLFDIGVHGNESVGVLVVAMSGFAWTRLTLERCRWMRTTSVADER